jgi:Holliday junction DNA helicase RuvA
VISRISGILKERKEHSVIVDVGGIFYEVFIPQVVMSSLNETTTEDEPINLVTYHYFQMDHAKGMPFLVGFSNDIEKEFFEKFISVSGIGPKAAIKALRLPLSTIARAIDEGNLSLLKGLPGVGEQRAKEIVAKLQGKIGKFGLIQDSHTPRPPELEGDMQKEALQVLQQLQYKKAEAKQMVSDAVSKHPEIKSAEELLNEIYKQKRVK